MYENDEIEIDLSRVFEIIRKHFKPFALIVLAASIVAALITLFLIPKKYTAEAKLIIVQKSNPDSQQISYNDLQTSQKLVNTYSEILKSEALIILTSSVLIIRLSRLKIRFPNTIGTVGRILLRKSATKFSLSAMICLLQTQKDLKKA